MCGYVLAMSCAFGVCHFYDLKLMMLPNLKSLMNEQFSRTSPLYILSRPLVTLSHASKALIWPSKGEICSKGLSGYLSLASLMQLKYR